MLFADALDIHNSFTPEESHSDILGDGYLIQSNRIYRAVKAFSQKIGTRYIEAYPEYLLLPFHELPKIVQTKSVPYVPSARLMKSLEKDRPGVFATEDVPVPESYHLHEAAHVIANHFLKDLRANSQEEQILEAIVAESFANTVDALACSQAGDEIHSFFIKQNCYMRPQKENIRAMHALLEKMGFRFTFMLTFFSYVQANFLAKPLSKRAILELAESYAPGKKMSALVLKDIETVSALGEQLDPQFRLTTTNNYFKQQGFEGDLHDLLDFKFMKTFASRPEFKKAVEAMCDAIA